MTALKSKTLVGVIFFLIISACSPEILNQEVQDSTDQTVSGISSPREEPMTSTKPLVIAHRGARSLAPENTLAAARKAFEIGADMWELDVSVSKDRQLFLMHDDTLDRTCNATEIFPDRKPWNNYDFTLDEIRQLDCGSWFNSKDPFKQIKAGVVSQADQDSYVGEKAPTLREALEYTKSNNWTVNIEIKGQPDDLTGQLAVEKTVALVEELGMDDGRQVAISSFEHSYLKQVQKLNSNIPIQILTEDVIRNLDDYLAEFDTRFVNPKGSVWSDKQLKEMSDSGIKFNVWTVNDESLMRALIEAHVNGIITDFPQVLIPLLGEE